jgi:peptidoglycan hydrolase-like protein with peptidoglycan-binding domain
MAPKAKLAPANSSPAEQAGDPEVEKLQRELKRQGYYAGEIDGRMGKDTHEAVRRRDDAATSKNSVKVSENNRAAKAAENDPVNQATKMATEAVPYASGVVAGTALGHYAFGKPFAERARGARPAATTSRARAWALCGRTMRSTSH